MNISSIAGLVPLRLQSAYVAAKAGVANLTRSMAVAYGKDSIRTNVVCPGYMRTGRVEDLATERAENEIDRLTETRDDLQSSTASRQAALDLAREESATLSILAGTTCYVTLMSLWA